MLHTDTDLPITVESPIEAHYVGRVTLVQHLQLTNNLVPDSWLDFQMNKLQQNGEHGQPIRSVGSSKNRTRAKHTLYLSSHNQSGGFVAHFVDHSSVPSTQLTDGLKVVILQLTHLSLLGEEGFETLPLLLIQVQLPELLLQGFQIRSNQQVKKKSLWINPVHTLTWKDTPV